MRASGVHIGKARRVPVPPTGEGANVDFIRGDFRLFAACFGLLWLSGGGHNTN
jgi:hypothetical protein